MNKEIEKVIATMGSQRALAKALGISCNAVSKWVSKGCIPPGRAVQIASIVDQKIATNKKLRCHKVSIESLVLESQKYNKEANHVDDRK